ncbi:MAG: GDP-mannose 4,6-dehydratase [Nitrospirae bacterium]|nr:GDP-mannose 4,6-dehydratase [Nitrospirota bacterium]
MILKNKNVLVTGAEGFIGSHLVEMLLGYGCYVKAFTYYNSFGFLGWLDAFPEKQLKEIDIFTGDIRDPICVRNAVKGVNIVFHLAALIGIPYSYHSPDSYVDTNIKGTLNVLQSSRDYEIERLVVTSTSEVYGTAQYVPIDERHQIQAQSPYSATKIGADVLSESFYRAFSLPVVIARPFNTYGPRQSVRAVIPTIITQLLGGSKQIKLGVLHPTRDFNYVSDICNGFISICECDQIIGKAINIGSGQEISILNLAEFLINIINPDAMITTEDDRKRPKNSEVERLLCDNSLIRMLTDWEPKVTLKEGLLKTIEWFKDNQNINKYKQDMYNI